jgi:hypothetical protein
MNIYILSRVGSCNYDEYRAKIIVAKNETRARELANINTGGEGKIWNNPLLIYCETIQEDKEEIILEEYKA